MQENPTNQPYYEEDSEIDIMELIVKLWKKRRFIIKWCIGGAILGLIIGFSIPKTYKASVVLAPENTDPRSGGLSSLASMAGINMQNGVDAINADMYPDVIHSTSFIFDLFDIPVTFEHKDTTVNTILLDYMLEYQKTPWWNPILKFPYKVIGWCVNIFTPSKEETISCGPLNPKNLPKKERDVVKYFAKNIIVNVDKKSFKISISLEMQDPKVAYVVLEAIIDNLKSYMSDYRSSKARQDVENLSVIYTQRKNDYYKAQQAYATYVDSNKNVSLQSAQVERERLQQEMNLAYQVYSQVASNLEGARIQEQQSKPVFVIINPATVPIKRFAPSKPKILLVSTFLTLCCALFWILFGEEKWKILNDKL